MQPIRLSLSSCCAFIAHQLHILPYIPIRSIKQIKILGGQYQTNTNYYLHHNYIHSNRIYNNKIGQVSSSIMEAHPVSQYITDIDGKWRLCAGVAIFNSNNEILIGERIGITPTTWQAPQESPPVHFLYELCVQYEVSLISSFPLAFCCLCLTSLVNHMY